MENKLLSGLKDYVVEKEVKVVEEVHTKIYCVHCEKEVNNDSFGGILYLVNEEPYCSPTCILKAIVTERTFDEYIEEIDGSDS